MHFSPGHHKQGFRNIRRQRLYRVTMAYAVAAWLAVQVTDIMTAVFPLPDWSVGLVLTISFVGWPVALIAAWIRERRVVPRDGEPKTTPESGRILDYVVIGVLIGMAAGLLAFDPDVSELGMRKIDSIAVMPFRDLSEQKVRAQLGDGLAGELLNSLTRVESLRVAARTSSFAFRDSGGDIKEIGRYLNVDAIVEGSLRVSGGQIRITVQLIDSRDGFNIWSHTYSRRMDDILDLQAEIGASVADALRGKLLGARNPLRSTLVTDSDSRSIDRHASNPVTQTHVRSRNVQNLNQVPR